MTTFRLANIATHLASRDRGRRVRVDVRNAVECGEQVEIDLTDVLSVSDSFADELFAVLAQEEGDEWFRANINVVGASPVVRSSIVRAVRIRLEGPNCDVLDPGRGYRLSPPPELLT